MVGTRSFSWGFTQTVPASLAISRFFSRILKPFPAVSAAILLLWFPDADVPCLADHPAAAAAAQKPRILLPQEEALLSGTRKAKSPSLQALNPYVPDTATSYLSLEVA